MRTDAHRALRARELPPRASGLVDGADIGRLLDLFESAAIALVTITVTEAWTLRLTALHLRKRFSNSRVEHQRPGRRQARGTADEPLHRCLRPSALECDDDFAVDVTACL
jgi:hypothetical protein